MDSTSDGERKRVFDAVLRGDRRCPRNRASGMAAAVSGKQTRERRSRRATDRRAAFKPRARSASVGPRDLRRAAYGRGFNRAGAEGPANVDTNQGGLED